ncbi:MAG TPA: PASTA domain-containing protein [Solirubrobacteraceae bacterium]|nr:PASTA domain-containing protein [Solirubrobacteraceae bacterium]
MTDRIALPDGASQRAKITRRGAGAGSQSVSDYVGQPASEAAQAVRRAGLRPGLDRSFGCPAELIGLVVAQEPTAGSDLARNGMVTLYVAAPGEDPPGSTANAAPADDRQSEDELSGQAPIEQQPSTAPPVRSEAISPQGSPAQSVLESPEVTDDDVPVGALENEFTGELHEGESAHEDFVVQVEDVLAGRSTVPGRHGAYFRRHALGGLGSGGRSRAWLGEHRLLAGAVIVALTFWVVLGATSTLRGHHARTSATSVLARKPVLGAIHSGQALKAATARNRSLHKTTVPPARSHVSRLEKYAERQRHIPVVARRERASVLTVNEAVAPPSDQTSAPRVSGPPEPEPEQSDGGEFSP